MNKVDMPLNPYEPPRDDSSKALATSIHLRALRGPALGLLALAGLQLMFGLIAFVIAPLVIVIMFSITVVRSPESAPIILGGLFADAFEDAVSFLGLLVSTLSCLLIFRGARSMRRGEHYRRAKTAAVLSCIPFLSPIVYCGIPFGIWALVVLRRPEVRAEFERSPASLAE